MNKDRISRLMQLLLNYSRLKRNESLTLGQLAQSLDSTVEQTRADLSFLFQTGSDEFDSASFIDLSSPALDTDSDSLNPDETVQIRNDQGLSAAVRLTQNELAAIQATLAYAATDLGTHNSLWQEIIDQITAVHQADTVRRPVHIHDDSSQTVEQQLTIEAAITAGHDVTITYTDTQGNVSSRRIHPEHIVRQQQHLYVQSWCFQAGAQRTFRLDRISVATEHDHALPRPDTLFAQGELLSTEPITVQFTTAALWLLDQLHPENVSITYHDDGTLSASFTVYQRTWLVRLLTQIAAHIVDAPAEILRDIRAYGRELDTLYTDDMKGDEHL